MSRRRRNPHVFYQWKHGDTDRPLKFYVAKRFYSPPTGKRKAYYVIRVKGTKGDVAEHWTKAAANKDAARRNKAERKRRKKVWAAKFGKRFAKNPCHRRRIRNRKRSLRRGRRPLAFPLFRKTYFRVRKDRRDRATPWHVEWKYEGLKTWTKSDKYKKKPKALKGLRKLRAWENSTRKKVRAARRGDHSAVRRRHQRAARLRRRRRRHRR